MNYSRKQLEALGEPLGDSATYKKLGGGYVAGGGGSSSPAPSGPTTQTVTQTSIPEYAQPYAEKLMGQAQALTDINQNPYQQYKGERVAGFSDLQKQAQGNIAGMQTSGALNAGINSAQNVADRAANLPAYANPQFQNMGLGYLQAQASNAQSAQLGNAPTYGGASFQGPGNVNAQNTYTGNFIDPYAAQAYMSPYQQNVTDWQKQQAVMDYGRQLPGMNAQAVGSGAFGGSRQAIQQSEAQRNLQNQLGGIQATGTQNAFQNAQQQYNADQARQLQSQQANQGANLQASLANQQAGYNTNLQNANLAQQAGLSNQALAGQYGLQQGQFNQAANLLNSQQGLQASLANQQAYGQMQGQGLQQNLAQNQQNVQNAQFGANYGLQGLQQQLAAAGQLGQLGQTQYGQQMGINTAQQQAGAQQQALNQQGLTNQYQDFLNQQKYPYQQIGFMSDVLRGMPASNSAQTMYQAPPSMYNQLGGAGLAGLGALMYGRTGGSGQ